MFAAANHRQGAERLISSSGGLRTARIHIPLSQVSKGRCVLQIDYSLTDGLTRLDVQKPDTGTSRLPGFAYAVSRQHTCNSRATVACAVVMPPGCRQVNRNVFTGKCRSISATQSSLSDSPFSRRCVRNRSASPMAWSPAQACRVRCPNWPNEQRTPRVRSCEHFPSVHHRTGRSCTPSEL